MSAVNATFTLESVSWTDARAVELRAVMDIEMGTRYDGSRSGTDEMVALVRAALSVDPDTILRTLIAVDADGTPIGHAALRSHNGDVEVKRVIVDANQRGRGVGRALMAGLEDAGRELGASRLVLQTGDRQPEAVSLYLGIGYTPIPIYEPYAEAIPFSMCFEKVL